MNVTVHLHGPLARPGQGKAQDVALPAGATLAVLVTTLGLRSGDVGVAMRAGLAILDRGGPLADGDILDLYPVVGGG